MNPPCDASKAEEMFNFFKNLMNMGKQMVDEILPDLVIDSEKKVLKELIDVGVDFKNSLEVFVKLCEVVCRKNWKFSTKNVSDESSGFGIVNPMVKNVKNIVPVDLSSPQEDIPSNRKTEDAFNYESKNVLPQTDAIPQVSHGVKEFVQNSEWKNLLIEVTKLFEAKKMVKEFYYCGFCSVGVLSGSVWNNHLKGKKHINKSKNLPEWHTSLEDSTCTYSCSKCGFFICSDKKHIALISESLEHRKFDEKISNMLKPVSNTFPEHRDAQNDYLEENQGSEKNRNNAVSINIENTKNYNSNVIFRDTKINSNFVELNSEITCYLKNRENFFFHYCLVCKVCCNTTRFWDKHSCSALHCGGMSNPDMANVECWCRQCPFGLSSDKKLAVVYMSYHIENCHQQSTDNIKVDEYMEIKQVAPTLGRHDDKNQKLKTTNQQDTARCSSANDVSSCRPNSANFGSLNGDTSSSRSSIDTCSNSGRSTPSVSNRPNYTRNHSRRKHTISCESTLDAPITRSDSPKNVANVSMVNGNDFMSLFVTMLNTKEERFQASRSYKPFAALCLICLRNDFESSFDWLDHITTHPSNDVENEVECSQCNSFLFGNVKDISKLLIPHRVHVRLDSMMNF